MVYFRRSMPVTPLRELKPELFEDERITDDEDSDEYGNIE